MVVRLADNQFSSFHSGKTGGGKGSSYKPNQNYSLSPSQSKQLEVIDSVESGKIVLKTNKQKGNYGEMKMDDYFETQGYSRISTDRVTSLDDKIQKGRDGVYENANPPPKFVIAEAKYNTAQLSNTRRSGRQMSDEWIEKENRLMDAIGSEKAGEVITEMIINPDNVEKSLINIGKFGRIKNSKINEIGIATK